MIGMDPKVPEYFIIFVFILYDDAIFDIFKFKSLTEFPEYHCLIFLYKSSLLFLLIIWFTASSFSIIIIIICESTTPTKWRKCANVNTPIIKTSLIRIYQVRASRLNVQDKLKSFHKCLAGEVQLEIHSSG